MASAIPSYATHLDEIIYRKWAREWKSWTWGLLPGGDALPEIKTSEDAAALIMIAANDQTEQKSFSFFKAHTGESDALNNDGIDIGTIAALIQYKKNLAKEGIARIFDLYFDPATVKPGTAAYLAAVVSKKIDRCDLCDEKSLDLLLDYAEKRIDLKKCARRISYPLDIHDAEKDLQLYSRILDVTMWYGSRNNMPDVLKTKALTAAEKWIELTEDEESAALELLNRYASNGQIKQLEPHLRAALVRDIATRSKEAFSGDKLREDWCHVAEFYGKLYGGDPGSSRQAMVEAMCQQRNEPSKDDPLYGVCARVRPSGGIIAPLKPAEVLAFK